MSVVQGFNPIDHIINNKFHAEDQKTDDVLKECDAQRLVSDRIFLHLTRANVFRTPLNSTQIHVRAVCQVISKFDLGTTNHTIVEVRFQIGVMLANSLYGLISLHLETINTALILCSKLFKQINDCICNKQISDESRSKNIQVFSTTLNSHFEFLKSRAYFLKRICVIKPHFLPEPSSGYIVTTGKFQVAARITRMISSTPNIYHQSSLEKIVEGLLKTPQHPASYHIGYLYAFTELIRNPCMRLNTFRCIQQRKRCTDPFVNRTMLNYLDQILENLNITDLKEIERVDDKFSSDESVDLLINELANDLFHPEISDQEQKAFVPRVAATMSLFLIKRASKKYSLLMKCNDKIKEAYLDLHFNSGSLKKNSGS